MDQRALRSEGAANEGEWVQARQRGMGRGGERKRRIGGERDRGRDWRAGGRRSERATGRSRERERGSGRGRRRVGSRQAAGCMRLLLGWSWPSGTVATQFGTRTYLIGFCSGGSGSKVKTVLLICSRLRRQRPLRSWSGPTQYSIAPAEVASRPSHVCNAEAAKGI